MDKAYMKGFRHIRYERTSAVSEGAECCDYRLRYEAAVEEMPAGYADTLMSCSPIWALPVVIIIGIVFSVLVSNATAKLFKLEKT